MVLRNGRPKAAATNLDNKFHLSAFAIGMLSGPDRIEKNKSLFLDRVWVTQL
jgi:hypothetical protein